jgi:hypothetical protein
MNTYFRLHPQDLDPERLLDPDEQVSQPWAGTIYGRCEKCGGSGRTHHTCESCTATGPDLRCPACGGRVRYLAQCPACEGTGEIDDSARQGVSVFPEEDGLYRYMAARDADVAGSKLVELEGRPSGDEDFDADEGALLVTPTRIVGVRPVDRRRLERATEPR